jgi:hypothetical protein
MKKIITLNEQQLINLIDKWVSNHIINEGRRKIYEDGFSYLYKMTFEDGSTFYSQSESPTPERFKNYILLTYKNKNKGELSVKINQSPNFKVETIFKSKDKVEVSNVKSQYVENDENSINIRKSGFKSNWKLDVIDINKSYTITDKDNNLYINAVLTDADSRLKSRVTTKNTLNVNGKTYYKVNNSSKINLVGEKSASLVKPNRVEDDSDGVTLTQQQLDYLIKSLKKEPSTFSIKAPDELISDEPSIKRLKGPKKYKYGVHPKNMTPEEILDWVISKGYETMSDMRNDVEGGGRYMYTYMGIKNRWEITKLLGKSYKKRKMRGKKTNIEKNAPQSKDQNNPFYSTSTSTSTYPNYNINYKIVEDSIRKILKNII